MARRIGKSYIVEEFAKNEYEESLVIDFSKVCPRVFEFFILYLDDLDELFLNLKIYFHNKKSGENYTIRSQSKFIAKYFEQLATPYLLHNGDLSKKDGIVYLPLYVTCAM